MLKIFYEINMTKIAFSISWKFHEGRHIFMFYKELYKTEIYNTKVKTTLVHFIGILTSV